VGSPRWAGSTLCARNSPRRCGSGGPDRAGAARAGPEPTPATRGTVVGGAGSGPHGDGGTPGSSGGVAYAALPFGCGVVLRSGFGATAGSAWAPLVRGWRLG